jgi:hypothetical protein
MTGEPEGLLEVDVVVVVVSPKKEPMRFISCVCGYIRSMLELIRFSILYCPGCAAGRMCLV